MSTIHTAMTGKSDSLIDAVRESGYKEVITNDNYDKLPATHPDHPDYMRLVVHQMD